MDMTGRTILVTGASSGIGRETSVLLGRLGAKVVMVARNEARLAAALSQTDGGPHLTEAYDLGQADEIPAWLKSITYQSGPLDGIVHCAGAQITRPLRNLSYQDVEPLMRVHVGASIALARGFRQKGVCRQGGSLVFLASVMGVVGEGGRIAYSAAKGALIGLVRSLAVELARENIRVNCISPAFVQTPMMEEMKDTLTSEQMASIEAKHLLGFGTPLDVAYAAAYLIADTGRWITGSNLVLDGGYTAT